MIHIATVHWRTDKWIDLQLEHLKINLSEPYRVYTYLTDVPEHHDSKFDFVMRGSIKTHSQKLNLLAEKIIDQAQSDSDLLMFLDGDAFPVRPLDRSLRLRLTERPLAALVQQENLGDCQPHPAFCMTTVGLWKKIKGDWTLDQAKPWRNSLNLPVIDVGAKVLQALEENKIAWLPILRSNRKNLHPLWFGIYGDFIYHHGSGFRAPTCRKDDGELAERFQQKEAVWLFENAVRGIQPDPDEGPFNQERMKHTARMQALSDSVYEEILKGDQFFQSLLE